MKTTNIRMNLDGLEDIKKQVGHTYRARVGILGSDAARTDETEHSINNATLGLIHLFGSISRNIPPRDWLVYPIEKNRRELIQSLQTGAMRNAFARKDYTRMFKLLGIKAEEFVQQAFVTAGFGTWEPNKPATIAAKGSSAPLIDTGQLRRAVTSDVVKDGSPPTTNHQQPLP